MVQAFFTMKRSKAFPANTFGGPLANIGLEPSRPLSCAIMSPWRAAQAAR